MPTAAPHLPTVLAAIDVGTNAVRLELARVGTDGMLEVLHQERDPIRPGEGVFKTGEIAKPVADRLVATMRRYAALCRRHHALVKAVATSAVREARNREEIVARVQREAGITLEAISGKEEARLICLGVLQGRSRDKRAVLIDIGGGSTEVVTAEGERPTNLWSLQLGAVRVTDLFSASGKVTPQQLRLMRKHASEVANKMLPRRMNGLPKMALGSSGTINAVVAFAAEEGAAHVKVGALSQAVEQLAAMTPSQRRKHFDAQRADIVLGGAVVLEMVTRHLKLDAVAAVSRGLRDGILVDLLRRSDAAYEDRDLPETALAMARRFGTDEPHTRKVRALALSLFDQLAKLHKLPINTRPYLEVAAVLHDIGNAVSYERHHKHSYYLIHHADLPGLTDRERELVARIARYHRRADPEVGHSGMAGLEPNEVRVVRRLATLLRVADALDRSHRQPVEELVIRSQPAAITLKLHPSADGALDLELWNVEKERALFKRVFGKQLNVAVAR